MINPQLAPVIDQPSIPSLISIALSLADRIDQSIKVMRAEAAELRRQADELDAMAVAS